MDRTTGLAVSVCINTFNQSAHIHDTIKSILSQKTNFSFEIVIHDDASTDGTAEIVSDYANKYPSKIRAILQSKNQYSDNPHKPFRICWDSAIGDYIALCEGDDYWIDQLKLQKQYELIERAGTDICFTNAYRLLRDKREEYFESGYNPGEVVGIEDLLRRGGGAMPTASILIRKTILQNLPGWFDSAPVGDFFIQILGTLRNGASYIADRTVVYRVQSQESWSSRRLRYSESHIGQLADSYIEILSTIDFPENAQRDVNNAISRELFQLAVLSYNCGYSLMASKLISESWDYYKVLNYKQLLMYVFRVFLKLAR